MKYIRSILNVPYSILNHPREHPMPDPTPDDIPFYELPAYFIAQALDYFSTNPDDSDEALYTVITPTNPEFPTPSPQESA